MASVTAREALAIVGVLGVVRFRHPRQLILIAVAFVVVYAANVAVLSVHSGRLVVVSKSSLFGSGAESWWLRESMIDFDGQEKIVETIEDKDETRPMGTHYARRLFADLGLILRNIGPILLASHHLADRLDHRVDVVLGLAAGRALGQGQAVDLRAVAEPQRL